MSSILLMNFLDVARSLGRSPLTATSTDVAAFVWKQFRRTGGLFNYNSSINALYDVFRGGMSLAAAEELCRTSGSPAGRKPNGDAIRIAGAFAAEHPSNCYRIPFTAVPIGRLSDERTAFMSIKAPLVRVEHDRAYVVVPGFRMGHRPVEAEIDVAASLALAQFGRDDFHAADFEYVSAGPCGNGGRICQVFHGRDRTIYNLDQLDKLLDTFVKGLEMAITKGLPAREPSFRGYRVVNPAQDRFI